MSWVLLVAAIFFETSGTLCLKFSQGFTRLWPTLGLVVFYALCFFCLSLAVRKIDLAIAYAVWSGVGTALITTFGVLFFKQALTPLQVFFLVLIMIGVVGLNLVSQR
ncbi:MAG: DMT family transporter [Bdellovibrionia bacterium]